jgi:hypothetical protein
MKKGLGILAVLAGTVTGVVALAEATQNRPDPIRSGTTTVEWSVRTKDVDVDLAAVGLWAVCRNTISGLGDPTPIAVDAIQNRYAAAVTPRLGHNARRRLQGCLEDATIDRVNGHDVSFAEAG